MNSTVSDQVLGAYNQIKRTAGGTFNLVAYVLLVVGVLVLAIIARRLQMSDKSGLQPEEQTNPLEEKSAILSRLRDS